jgi:hypothetical protein
VRTPSSSQWLAEAQGERLAAETELAALDQPKQVTADDLAQLIDDIRQDWGDLTTALGAAQPQDKAALLTALGVSVSYDPVARTARVTCRPRVSESVVSEGGLRLRLKDFSPGDVTVAMGLALLACGSG